MSQQQAIWTRRAIEAVENGVHDYEDVVRMAAVWVPEGHAWRASKRDTENSRRRWSVSNPRPEMSDRRRIRSGARTVVKRSVQGLVERGSLVRIGDELHLPNQVASELVAGEVTS